IHIIDIFRQSKVSGISFLKGIELSEYETFIWIVSLPAESGFLEKGLQVSLEEKKISHIVGETARYIRVAKGKKISISDGVEGEETDVQINRFLEGKPGETETEVSKSISKALIDPENLAKVVSERAGISIGLPVKEEKDSFNKEEVLSNICKIGKEYLNKGSVSIKKSQEFLEKMDVFGETLLKNLGKLKTDNDIPEEISTILGDYKDKMRMTAVVEEFLKKQRIADSTKTVVSDFINSFPSREKMLSFLHEELIQKKISGHEYSQLVNMIDKIHPDVNKTDSGSSESLVSEIRKTLEGAFESSDKTKELFETLTGQFEIVLEKRINDATNELQKKNQIISQDKERMDLILKNVADGVVVVDEAGKVVFMNKPAEGLLGSSFGEKGGVDSEIELNNEQMITLFKDMESEDASGWTGEIEIQSNPDVSKTLRASAGVIQNQDGKTVGMVSVLHDVTKQKELNQFKNEIITNVSHELRNPLNSLKQTISLFLDGVLGNMSEEHRRYLSIADRGVDRLTRMVNDLLDLSKIEAGKMLLKKDECIIADVISDAIAEMKPWADAKSLDLRLHEAPDINSIIVDRDRIIQVFVNLISNSIKFTDKGGKIDVSIIRGTDDEGKDLVLFKVEDNGIGIPLKDLDKVFEKYHHLASSTSMLVKGTGLGLPIAKEIIQLHGGKIQVESEEGKGTVISFSLPVKPVEENE
ncbi:MAG: ATP-binding protein, partial [Candidatus Theseobacter exili]|nr:ATP-binding protein [Candidatus Theseobacter exili]